MMLIGARTHTHTHSFSGTKDVCIIVLILDSIEPNLETIVIILLIIILAIDGVYRLANLCVRTCVCARASECER